MSKTNNCLMFFFCFLLWSNSVKSSVASMKYKIIFSKPSIEVLDEKQRIINLYRELSFGVSDESMYEVVQLSKEAFLGEKAKKIDIKDGTVYVYMDEKGTISIDGNFENVCESKIVKKAWINRTKND